MHTISRLVLVSSLLFMTVPFAACKKNQGTHVVKQVRVSATKAYEKYFGPAPTTDKGSCFAFVIYFPSAKNPGKVVPFPFFTFDKESIKKVAVERLLAGMKVRVRWKAVDKMGRTAQGEQELPLLIKQH